MAQNKTDLNDADRKLTIAVLDKELKAVKRTKPEPVHEIAVDRYKDDLVRVLNKLDKRERYYTW